MNSLKEKLSSESAIVDTLDALLVVLEKNRMLFLGLGIDVYQMMRETHLVKKIAQNHKEKVFYFGSVLAKETSSLESLAEKINAGENITNIDRHVKSIFEKIKYMLLLIKKWDKKTVNYGINVADSYNSDEYYKELTEKLKKERIELERQLFELESSRKQLSDRTAGQKQELDEKIKEIDTVKEELSEAKKKLLYAEKKLEEKKKQEDAQEVWKKKISTTFTKLTDYLDPISNEYRRLKFLFNFYRACIWVTIVILIAIEVIICGHLAKEAEVPRLIDYLPFYAPVPITGGLLWAFITQMNRAQRQLVVLSEHIHNVKYIEGLLLALNELAPDVDNAVKRINEAIDKLLENHLKISSKCILGEESIRNEEKRDNGMLPIDSVIEMLKQVKSMTK